MKIDSAQGESCYEVLEGMNEVFYAPELANIDVKFGFALRDYCVDSRSSLAHLIYTLNSCYHLDHKVTYLFSLDTNCTFAGFLLDRAPSTESLYLAHLELKHATASLIHDYNLDFHSLDSDPPLMYLFEFLQVNDTACAYDLVVCYSVPSICWG